MRGGSRIAVTGACVAVFLGSWTLLHHGWYSSAGAIVDLQEYQSYAGQIADGRIPYRDFEVEYPPGALLPMLAPDATSAPGDYDSYSRTFERWMAGAGVAMVLLAAAGLAALRAPPAHFTAALALVAVSPLLLGNIMLSRFDLWVAALTVGAVAALAARRDLLGGGILGAAIATKLVPAVIVPLGLVWVWQRRGRRAALGWLALVVAVVVAAYLPFAVLSPAGVHHSFGLQARRPLQIESLGSVVLLALHTLTGYSVSVISDFGSQNLGSSASGAVADLTTAAQALALVALWIAFARRPANAERLVAAAAAAMTIFVGFGKVVSPQFMIWLVPLVPLVRSRTASSLLVAALVLTQIEFPARYWWLVGFVPWVIGVVLARDLVVLALAAVLARAALGRAPSQSARRTRFEALRAIRAQAD